MPRKNDYPFANFKSCIEIAEAVDDLGGTCSIETCAHKLDKQPTSGGYKMIISSAVKYGLIHNSRGTLSLTSDYKLLKHAYTDEEKVNIQRKLFLRPEVFNNLYQRFIGKTLPLPMLDKIMIREMGVDENTAGRVSGYFVKGLKEIGLLDGGNIVLAMTDEQTTESKSTKEENEEPNQQSGFQSSPSTTIPTRIINSTVFTISITGPGVNNTFQILEEEDIEWVEVAIRKIKRALKSTALRNEGTV